MSIMFSRTARLCLVKRYFSRITDQIFLSSGTDGRVYRSPCYVKYFSCLLDIDIQIDCNKECPCNETSKI
jgi:hypothetical protein